MNQITLKERLIRQIADNYLCSLHHDNEGRKQVATCLRKEAIGVMNFGRDQFGMNTEELHRKAMEIFNEKNISIKRRREGATPSLF